MKKFVEVERPHMVGIEFHTCFVNDKYMVDVRFETKEKMDGWVWLSIKRKDKNVIKDWREMQRIKNAICGDEREGLELYPAESRLVDTSNQFHIFVMPTGERFPFGYGDRLVVEGHDGGFERGSKQRHFKEQEQPKDALPIDEMKKLAKKFMEEGAK